MNAYSLSIALCAFRVSFCLLLSLFYFFLFFFLFYATAISFSVDTNYFVSSFFFSIFNF